MNDNCTGFVFEPSWVGVRPIKRLNDLVRWDWSENPNAATVSLIETPFLSMIAAAWARSVTKIALRVKPVAFTKRRWTVRTFTFLMLSPWSAVFAGLAILALSFGLNLLGDALRDTLDPRLRSRA